MKRSWIALTILLSSMMALLAATKNCRADFPIQLAGIEVVLPAVAAVDEPLVAPIEVTSEPETETVVVSDTPESPAEETETSDQLAEIIEDEGYDYEDEYSYDDYDYDYNYGYYDEDAGADIDTQVEPSEAEVAVEATEADVVADIVDETMEEAADEAADVVVAEDDYDYSDYEYDYEEYGYEYNENDYDYGTDESPAEEAVETADVAATEEVEVVETSVEPVEDYEYDEVEYAFEYGNEYAYDEEDVVVIEVAPEETVEDSTLTDAYYDYYYDIVTEDVSSEQSTDEISELDDDYYDYFYELELATEESIEETTNEPVVEVAVAPADENSTVEEFVVEENNEEPTIDDETQVSATTEEPSDETASRDFSGDEEYDWVYDEYDYYYEEGDSDYDAAGYEFGADTETSTTQYDKAEDSVFEGAEVIETADAAPAPAETVDAVTPCNDTLKSDSPCHGEYYCTPEGCFGTPPKELSNELSMDWLEDDLTPPAEDVAEAAEEANVAEEAPAETAEAIVADEEAQATPEESAVAVEDVPEAPAVISEESTDDLAWDDEEMWNCHQACETYESEYGSDYAEKYYRSLKTDAPQENDTVVPYAPAAEVEASSDADADTVSADQIDVSYIRTACRIQASVIGSSLDVMNDVVRKSLDHISR